MKAVGIVVEYNPFHNGHVYHANEARKNGDCVIACMSGNWLQRGEPALVSKWKRTKMALNHVDIIVELPYAFAVQYGKLFAQGAVSILDALECETLCFGSEHGNIKNFIDAVIFANENEQSLNNSIRESVQSGKSYASSSANAFQNVSLDLSKPNNILGFYYVDAIRRLSSKMIPTTITRSNSYHAENITDATIASATAIRRLIHEQKQSQIDSFIPLETLEQLTNTAFHKWENYFSLLKYRILTMSHEHLRNIADMEEGLQYRFKKTILHATSFNDWITSCKSKRYTYTRLQRICTHILTDTKTIELEQFHNKTPYLRLLGMNEIGRKYIRSKKLPLISKPSSLLTNELFQLEIRATAAYSSILKEPYRSKLLCSEWEQHPIIQ